MKKLKYIKNINNRKNLYKKIKTKSKIKINQRMRNNQNKKVKKSKKITVIIAMKRKKINSMSQNQSMRNKSVIKRKANIRKISRSKKRILKRKTKIFKRKTKISRNKIRRSLRSKVVSLAITSVKAAITVTIQLFRKKRICICSLNFMCAEVGVSIMITGLLITRNTLILKDNITSKGSMIIIRDSNTVMMISLQLISLFIIEEGEARSIIMIGTNIWSLIKCILLLWEGFKEKDITQKNFSKFLMGREAIMSKMKDSKDSSKVKMKE